MHEGVGMMCLGLFVEIGQWGWSVIILARHSRIWVQTSAIGVFWGIKGVGRWISIFSKGIVFLGWDWGILGWRWPQNSYFLGFPLDNALEVNKLALRESLSLVVMMVVIVLWWCWLEWFWWCIRNAIKPIYRSD